MRRTTLATLCGHNEGLVLAHPSYPRCMILYLHGFRSGPQSFKARQLQAHMAQLGLADHFWCEQLAWGPQAAMAQVSQIIEATLARDARPTLVGSSLGGFYATHLAERYGLKAVVVNPSVVSHLTLEPWLGPQTQLYTGETFELTPQHLDELRALEVPHIAEPRHYWLLVETGDEVLNYRHAVEKYLGAHQTILKGGDHSFTRWADYLPDVVRFAGLRRHEH